MKKLLLLQFLFCFFLHTLASTRTELGQETIEPLRFPKFTIGGEYAMLRHMQAFNGSNLKRSLNNTFGANLYAEAGLVKYLNAGLTVSFTKSTPILEGSNIYRMGLFLKPYLPLGSRVSVFSRLGVGPSISLGTEASGYLLLPGTKGEHKFAYTYGLTAYWPFAAGFNGGATLGLEAFITSRFALVAEWGIRADMLWAKILEREIGGNKTLPKSGNPPPNWFHYFIYDMPIMVSMHIIL